MTSPLHHPTGFPRWEVPQDLDTPAVVIDVERAEANIERMVARLTAKGVELRPHSKTHKSLEVARRQLAAGAVGITTATLSEAEVMAEGGIRDLFVAYPVWAAGAKAERLRRVLRATDRLRVGVDSPAGAARLGDAVRDERRELEVLVEVDSGELRTGTVTAERTVAVARACEDAGLTFAGVFTHGGHSYAGPDLTGAAADDEVDALTASVEALGAAGFEVGTVSAGSTPTALASARGVVTEERPGTFVFGDRQQTMLGATAAEDVAIFVAGTCVSREAPGRFILDAGAKAYTKDKPALLDGFGSLPAYPEARIVSAYDHHAVVEVGADGRAPALGEVIAIVPNHACPVVNLHDVLHIWQDGRIVDRWPVDARGRSQ